MIDRISQRRIERGLLRTRRRGRLAASARPDRIFEAVRSVVAETGVLAGKSRRALDSVVLDDAVATQDTVTQLIAAVRRVCREVPGAAAVDRSVERPGAAPVDGFAVSGPAEDGLGTRVAGDHPRVIVIGMMGQRLDRDEVARCDRRDRR